MTYIGDCSDPDLTLLRSPSCPLRLAATLFLPRPSAARWRPFHLSHG